MQSFVCREGNDCDAIATSRLPAIISPPNYIQVSRYLYVISAGSLKVDATYQKWTYSW